MKCTLYLRAFFRSPFYPFVIAALMTVSELFGAELIVYYLYLLFGLAAVLFGEDTLGILPIACCGYMTFSAKNNPGRFPETTAFRNPAVYIQLIVIAAIAAVMLIARLVFALFYEKRRGKPALLFGFLALGAGYLLAGAFSGYYALNTVYYGALQIVCLCALYFYFYYTVDWAHTDKKYVFWVFLALGAGLIIETAGMYFNENVWIDGVIHRENLYTGWGICNNMGGMMALCMPAPFYFALTAKKHGWVFSALGCVYYLAILFTNSRTAILFGGVVFAACVLTVLIRLKGKDRIWSLIVFGAVAVGCGITIAIVRDAFFNLFRDFDDSGRFGIYRDCWKAFTDAPIFGNGFYHTPGAVMTKDGNMYFVHPGEASDIGFIPARAHNTIFQLLASGGLFALGTYLFHRVQTAILLLKHPGPEKIVILLMIASLLLTSLLDCHFFNLGPGLLYSVLLVWAERGEEQEAKSDSTAA